MEHRSKVLEKRSRHKNVSYRHKGISANILHMEVKTVAKRNKYWVVWNSILDKWQLKKEGNSIALRNFDRKQDAIDYGIQVARNNQPSQLIIKKKDGTIEEERTYGDDQYPPRG